MTVANLPTTMTVIQARQPGGPDVLEPTVRGVPVAAAGRSAGEGRGRRGEPARPDAAAGQVPAAAGRVRHPRARAVWRRRCGRRQRVAVARWRPRDGAGGGWRLCGVRGGARTAMSAGAARAVDGGGGGAPRDVLHGLGQRLRARPACGGRVAARARRRQRHRDDRDPAGARARCTRVRDGRLAREVRGVRAARRRAGDQLSRRGFRRDAARRDRAGVASTSFSTWSAATMSPATSKSWRWTGAFSRSRSSAARIPK